MSHRLAVALAVLAASHLQPAAAQDFDLAYPVCLAAIPVMPDEALEACTTLIDSPRDWPADRGTLFYDRARVHQWMRKPERALVDMDEAVKLRPNDAALLYARALLLEDMDRTEEAVRGLGDALRAGYPPVNGLPRRGFLALKLGRLDTALADFEAALKVDPANAEGLFGRGVVRLKKGDQDGKTDIVRARAVDETIAERVGVKGY